MATSMMLLFAVVTTTMAASAKYKVVVKTADVSDAGTDSWVYLTITGTKGHTTEKGLDNTGNDMPRGGTDVYNLDLEDVGKFKCIKFRLDGKDGWMPESVEVYKDTKLVYKSGKRNIFLDDYKTFNYCRKGKMYSVFLETSDVSNAGTDDWVYMTISGSKGWTNEVELDLPGVDDMKRGRTDNHVLGLEDVGAINCVQFQIDGKDGWNVKRVTVYVGGQLKFDSGDNLGFWLDDYAKKTFCQKKSE